jgi:predicted site-specific integrase-resolvase
MTNGTLDSLNLRQAAAEAEISEKTLRAAIRSDRLVATRRPNGHLRITREDLARFLNWYRGTADASD